MILEQFSEANKRLIEYKPLFNHVVKAKSLDFETHQGKNSNIHFNNKSVLLICDFEGKVVFVNESFSESTCLRNLQDNSLLDFLHQEDLPIVIEQMVDLLQGKTHSLTIETRFINSENQSFYSKWHVGYFRELFYFYPIELPKYLKNITESKEISLNLNRTLMPDQLLWKIEISKILYEWDAQILKQIKECTNI